VENLWQAGTQPFITSSLRPGGSDTLSVGLSIFRVRRLLFEKSCERFGELLCFQAESRGALCREFFAG